MGRTWDGCRAGTLPLEDSTHPEQSSQGFPMWLLSPTSWPSPKLLVPPTLAVPQLPPQALFSSEGHPGRHGVGLQRLHLVIEGDGGLLCSPQPTVSFTPLTGRQGYVPIIQTRKLRFRKAEQPCSHLQGDVGAGLGSGLGWLLSTPCLTLGSYLGLWVLQFQPLWNGALLAASPEVMWVSVEPWDMLALGWCCSHAPCAPHSGIEEAVLSPGHLCTSLPQLHQESCSESAKFVGVLHSSIFPRDWRMQPSEVV